jgi:hypothetical protein
MLLVKDAERIELDRFFLLNYYFTAIYTFPRIKIKKVIKKSLKNHESVAFCASHTKILPEVVPER